MMPVHPASRLRNKVLQAWVALVPTEVSTRLNLKWVCLCAVSADDTPSAPDTGGVKSRVRGELAAAFCFFTRWDDLEIYPLIHTAP